MPSLMISTAGLSHKPLQSMGSVVLGCTLKHFPNKYIPFLKFVYLPHLF